MFDRRKCAPVEDDNKYSSIDQSIDHSIHHIDNNDQIKHIPDSPQSQSPEIFNNTNYQNILNQNVNQNDI